VGRRTHTIRHVSKLTTILLRWWEVPSPPQATRRVVPVVPLLLSRWATPWLHPVVVLLIFLVTYSPALMQHGVTPLLTQEINNNNASLISSYWFRLKIALTRKSIDVLNGICVFSPEKLHADDLVASLLSSWVVPMFSRSCRWRIHLRCVDNLARFLLNGIDGASQPNPFF
jgi:hypothetical protein